MTCKLFDNNCGKHGACGPVLARYSVGRTLAPGRLLSSTKQLSRLSYSTAARRGILPNRHWHGLKDSICKRHIRWLESINLGGAPTRFGCIQRWRTFWKNTECLPLPNISRSAALPRYVHCNETNLYSLGRRQTAARVDAVPMVVEATDVLGHIRWNWIRCGRWSFGWIHCC